MKPTFALYFPHLRTAHAVKDVAMYLKYISEYYDSEAVIYAYMDRETDYSAFESRGVKVRFLTKFSGFATIDSLLHLSIHARTIDLLNLYHFCRYSIVMAVFYRAFRLLTGAQPSVILKLDMNDRELEKLSRGRMFRLARLFAIPFDLVSAETKSVVSRLASLRLFKSVYCVPNGFSSRDSFQCNKNNTKENLLIHVTRLGAPTKNTDQFLRFAKNFVSGNPNWRIEIFGPTEPGYRPKIQKFVLENEISMDRISFLGMTSRDVIEHSLSRAKLMVVTSVEEGFSLAMVEARRWGCLVIAPKVGGVEDIFALGSAGYIYDGSDADLFEQASRASENEGYFSLNIYESERDEFGRAFTWRNLVQPIVSSKLMNKFGRAQGSAG